MGFVKDRYAFAGQLRNLQAMTGPKCSVDRKLCIQNLQIGR